MIQFNVIAGYRGYSTGMTRAVLQFITQDAPLHSMFKLTGSTSWELVGLQDDLVVAERSSYPGGWSEVAN